MTRDRQPDSFLEKRVVQYDRWLQKKQISFSSRVIPVSESLDARQWVLPTGHAMHIIDSARSIAVQNCICRTHYRRCDHPRDVCLLLDAVADAFVAKKKARKVTMRSAIEILKKASQSGLVHLALYRPEHEIFALCSCCSCCCHDLQIVRRYHRKDLMVRSDYIAVTLADQCIGCGECVDRCIFDARIVKDGQLEFTPDACLGCGLCVTVCPVKAISMVPWPSS